MERNEIAHYNTVVMRKDVKRLLSEGKPEEQISALSARVLTPGRISKGWHCIADAPITESIVDESGPARTRGNKPTTYIYRVTLHLDCKPHSARAGIDNEFRNIVSLLVATSNSWPNWQVESVNDVEWASADAKAIKDSGVDDVIGYAALDLPGNFLDYFGNLYDRDAQISIVMSALEAAIESEWRNRFHTVLMGPPACGKTELLATIRRMCGNDAVLVLDGTAITQAGIYKELDECEELPRVIIIEEIEKADTDALRVLLGLLDTRGELNKLTARTRIQRDCRVLCYATVNDIDKFETMLSGALASRFSHQVYCPVPDRALMSRILAREVALIGGDLRWIEACLDYMESINSSDPRKAIALCLSGRDGWLNGKYPEKLDKIRRLKN